MDMDIIVEKSLQKIKNRYLLVVLAARRARQLGAGFEPLVETKRSKPTIIALEEVAEGKASVETDENED